MGEAKRRGTFEERKAQAIAEGRRKGQTIRIENKRRYMPLGDVVEAKPTLPAFDTPQPKP